MQYLVFLKSPIPIANGGSFSIIATKSMTEKREGILIAGFNDVSFMVPQGAISGWFSANDQDPSFDEYVKEFKDGSDEFVDLRTLDYTEIEEGEPGSIPEEKKKTAKSIFEKL